MKPNKNISYHLLSDMTEEQYAALPEEVRRVYVSAAKKIPMSQEEKLATIQAYPEYFEKRQAKPFGQKVKRILNLKTKIEKIKTKAAVRDLQSLPIAIGTDKEDLQSSQPK